VDLAHSKVVALNDKIGQNRDVQKMPENEWQNMQFSEFWLSISYN